MAKAIEELQHAPPVDPKMGMDYKRNKQAKRLESPHALYSCFVVVGMLVLLASAFIPPPLLGPLELLRSFCIIFFGSRKAVKIFFMLACLLHIVEAVSAWFLAKKVDAGNAVGWFWQTFVLGYGSLLLLLEKFLAKGASKT